MGNQMPNLRGSSPGPKGELGDKGDVGRVGDRGQPGPKGERGDPGMTGAQGDRVSTLYDKLFCSDFLTCFYLFNFTVNLL